MVSLPALLAISAEHLKLGRHGPSYLRPLAHLVLLVQRLQDLVFLHYGVSTNYDHALRSLIDKQYKCQAIKFLLGASGLLIGMVFRKMG